MSRLPKLIFASFLFAGFTLIGIAPAQAKQGHVKSEDQVDSGTPLSTADKKHFLEDDFVIVKTVAGMPLVVQKKILGSGIRDGIADAGKPYQSTDVLGPKPLPFQRLVFAGTAPGYCVVYYECGGFAARQEMSLYRLSPGQAVLAWRAELQDDRKLLTLPELRNVIDKGKFYSLWLPK